MLLVRLTTARTADRNTGAYFSGNTFDFVQKFRRIHIVIHVPAFLLTGHNTSLMHQVQMPGNNRAILRHVFGNRADIRSAIQQQELQEQHPHRFPQCFEELGVKNLNQFFRNLPSRCCLLCCHIYTLMYTYAYVKKKIKMFHFLSSKNSLSS